jgi:hypothetical protein
MPTLGGARGVARSPDEQRAGRPCQRFGGKPYCVPSVRGSPPRSSTWPPLSPRSVRAVLSGRVLTGVGSRRCCAGRQRRTFGGNAQRAPADDDRVPWTEACGGPEAS